MLTPAWCLLGDKLAMKDTVDGLTITVSLRKAVFHTCAKNMKNFEKKNHTGGDVSFIHLPFFLLVLILLPFLPSFPFPLPSSFSFFYPLPPPPFKKPLNCS